jgi:hypothetical protein
MASTIGSRVFKTALGLFLVMMGVGGTLYLWGSWKKAEETRKWPSAEAVISSSQVLTDRATPHSPPRYMAEVHYRYQLNGQSYTGRRIKRVDGPSSQKGTAEATVAKYKPGETVTCHVNPAQPEVAILEPESRAALYSIWFPLLFVVGGAGMIVSAFRAKG